MNNLINLNNNQLVFITLILIPLIILLICSFNKNNYENIMVDIKEDFNVDDFLKNIGLNETELNNKESDNKDIPVINKKIKDEIVNKPEKSKSYNDKPNIINTDKKNMEKFRKSISLLNPIRITKLPNHNEKTDFDLKSKKCQFYDDKCPNGFTSLGTFSLLDDYTLSFEENNKKIISAKAISNISDGSITNIKIIDKGFGYKDAPKVSIIGDCKRRAIVKSIIDDNGSVVRINIIDKGDGYEKEPQINIDKPNISQYYMCCN